MTNLQKIYIFGLSMGIMLGILISIFIYTLIPQKTIIRTKIKIVPEGSIENSERGFYDLKHEYDTKNVNLWNEFLKGAKDI